jgi:hypothetical protein
MRAAKIETHPRITVPRMHRAYSYPLKLTVRQSAGLAVLMRLQCELHNAALEERRMTYRWLKVGISSVRVPSKLDQFTTLTGLSELRPELRPFGITVCRGTHAERVSR